MISQKDMYQHLQAIEAYSIYTISLFENKIGELRWITNLRHS